MNYIHNPKISIVLPVFNGQKYLRQALDSILDQTMKEWELIIVDDCSSDLTQKIVKEYMKKDKRIIYVRNNKNLKLPKSLNIGFEQSRGKYLTWTSDDNCYRSNALIEMSNALDENTDVMMVYAGMMNIDGNGLQLGMQGKTSFETIYITNIIGACFLYRREARENIGDYDIELFGVEDYDYWLRIVREYHIAYIDKILYDYRRHTSSLTCEKSNLIKNQKVILKKKHINWIIEIFENNYAMLCKLFFDYLEIVGTDCAVENKFYKFFPFLKFYKKNLDENKIIIFGAGKIGKEAFERLPNKTVAFGDNDIKKQGTFIRNIPVKSFGEIIGREETLVFAVSKSKIHELVLQLAEYNIEKSFCVYPFCIS